MHRHDLVARVERERIVAVLRFDDPSMLRPVVDALAAGGVRLFEVTMTVPDAVALIRSVVADAGSDVVCGAGTVLDADTAARVIDAGAAFVVSPVCRRSIIEACHERGVPAMPGCYTPTEILDAWDAGADIVKVFPATSLGPGYFKDLRAPLPHVKLMPTGGVTIENAGDWMGAGAAAVGIGSALVDAATVRRGDLVELTRRAERLVANISQIVRLPPRSALRRTGKPDTTTAPDPTTNSGTARPDTTTKR